MVKKISGIVAMIAFFALLAVVGGIEHDQIGIAGGLLAGFVSLAVLAGAAKLSGIMD